MTFSERDLSVGDYVYVWASGIHLQIRLEEAKGAVLVVMGVRVDGTKELIALAGGYRGSSQSWARGGCRRRGMRSRPRCWRWSPRLVERVERGLPRITRRQRCWGHDTANCRGSLSKLVQPVAKVIQVIYNAVDKEHAAAAVKAFAKQYGARFPKVVKMIVDGEDELLAFYDLPAEHWVHLRIADPIELTFAIVCLWVKVTKGAGSRAAGWWWSSSSSSPPRSAGVP
ncbi:transposase [Streptomyces sp. NPDC057743]|uniref:transposase n=1 Tax=Streptomyces sp. NPDC057743 TaxID=3346236 RepID=UPI0036AE5F28